VEGVIGLQVGGVTVSELFSNEAGGLAGYAEGLQIAGYRLEKRVGAGGMAVVFRARDERLGRPVALKILAPAVATDEAFRRRFIRESRARPGRSTERCSSRCGTCQAGTRIH
jgi:serine/threonine protein kinase